MKQVFLLSLLSFISGIIMNKIPDIPEEQEKTLIEEFILKQNELTQPVVTFREKMIFKDVNEMVYTKDLVSVRNIPDLKSEVIGTLPLYEIVQRIGVTDDGWSQVLYNGDEIFINSIYLQPITSYDITVIETPIVDENQTANGDVTGNVIVMNGATLNNIPPIANTALLNKNEQEPINNELQNIFNEASNEQETVEIPESVPESTPNNTIPTTSDDVGLSIVQTEGNVSSKFITTCQSYLIKLPTNVRQYLLDNGVNIYITDTNLAQRFFAGQYNSVMGATVYAEKNIYIEDRNNAIKSSTIHETGHIIDFLTGWSSSTQEFIDCFNAERFSFVEVGKQDNNSISSTTEYFAEVLNQAILYSDSCKKSAPSSYNYVMNIINNL